MTKIYSAALSLVIASFLAFSGEAAHAQDLSAARVQPGQQGTGQDGDMDNQKKDHFIIGAGAGYVPAYEGSRKYRVLPVPVIDIVWGPLFANLKDGIGVHVIDTQNFTIGVSATAMQGYRARDVPNGVGKLPYGLGARAFANVTEKGAVLSVGVTKGIAGGNKGVIVDASLSYPVAVSTRLTLTPSIQTTWANRNYNDRYFGLSAAQSAASGLPEFQAHSGFNDMSAIVNATYLINNHLIMAASGGVTRMIGDVKYSPLVQQKTQPAGFISMAYRF